MEIQNIRTHDDSLGRYNYIPSPSRKKLVFDYHQNIMFTSILSFIQTMVLIFTHEGFRPVSHRCSWSDRRSFPCALGRINRECPSFCGGKLLSHWCFHWDLSSKCSEIPSLSPNIPQFPSSKSLANDNDSLEEDQLTGRRLGCSFQRQEDR